MPLHGAPVFVSFLFSILYNFISITFHFTVKRPKGAARINLFKLFYEFLSFAILQKWMFVDFEIQVYISKRYYFLTPAGNYIWFSQDVIMYTNFLFKLIYLNMNKGNKISNRLNCIKAMSSALDAFLRYLIWV